jgi:hypothetical protein
MAGTIHLSAPAPPGGTQVTLVSTPNGRTTFNPPVVHIAEGSTGGTFTLTGASAGSAKIAATAPGYETTGTSSLLVVAFLGALILEPEATVEAESSVTLLIRLTSPAPVGGVTISLVSDDANTAQVPGTVFIPQGATAPAAPPSVTGIAAGVTTISATAQNYFGAVQTVTVTAKPAKQAVLGAERNGSQTGEL